MVIMVVVVMVMLVVVVVVMVVVATVFAIVVILILIVMIMVMNLMIIAQTLQGIKMRMGIKKEEGALDVEERKDKEKKHGEILNMHTVINYVVLAISSVFRVPKFLPYRPDGSQRKGGRGLQEDPRFLRSSLSTNVPRQRERLLNHQWKNAQRILYSGRVGNRSGEISRDETIIIMFCFIIIIIICVKRGVFWFLCYW